MALEVVCFVLPGKFALFRTFFVENSCGAFGTGVQSLFRVFGSCVRGLSTSLEGLCWGWGAQGVGL